jgi:hypothetical protein
MKAILLLIVIQLHGEFIITNENFDILLEEYL